MITKAARNRRMALEDRDTLMLVALLLFLSLQTLSILTPCGHGLLGNIFELAAELRNFRYFHGPHHLKPLDALREVW
jgi:hypothetical protein